MGDTAVHTADSKSLWNYTLSPGWTDKEIEVFVAALQKYGVGRWTRITKEDTTWENCRANVQSVSAVAWPTVFGRI